MKRNTVVMFFIVVFVLLINGCKKDETSVTSPIPIVKGDLMGYTILRNEKYVAEKNNSFITVSVEGTNLSSQTDSSGNYSIKGIEAGERVIVFTKTGYGIYKTKNTIVGNSTSVIGRVDIYEFPPFNVQNLKAKVISNNFELSGTLSNTLDGGRGIVCYAFSDSTVSSEPSKYLFSDYSTLFSGVNSFNIRISFSELLNNGFKSGQTVYFIMYGSIYNHPCYYYLEINKTVYCCLSLTPSNIVSVTIP